MGKEIKIVMGLNSQRRWIPIKKFHSLANCERFIKEDPENRRMRMKGCEPDENPFYHALCSFNDALFHTKHKDLKSFKEALKYPK